MKCLALSFGSMKYDWSRRDGIIPQTAVKSCAQNLLFSLPGEEAIEVYSLTMNNVQPSDEGWYCCVATNEGGSTMDCAWLDVNSKLALFATVQYLAICINHVCNKLYQGRRKQFHSGQAIPKKQEHEINGITLHIITIII